MSDQEVLVPSLWLKIRLLGATTILIGCFGLLAYRAWVLQVRDAGKLSALAEEQHQNDVEVPARRGRIFDRLGTTLAASTDVDSVKANPRQIGSNAPKVAEKLAPILKMDRAELEKKLASPRYFTWLKRRIAPDEAKQVRALDIPGIEMRTEPRRYYPLRRLAGQAIGWAGVDSVGMEGIELSYDKWLRGAATAISGLRDALGRPLFVDGIGNLEPQTGHDVVTTLDRFIQFRLEAALEKSVATNHAKAGVAVMLDPATGEILAMAAVPNVNPNEPEDAQKRGVRNRAVTDPFEPGSTIKTFTIAGAIEAGVTKPDDHWFCDNGFTTIAGAPIHDTHPIADASTSEVLAKSSNICTAKIGGRLGREKFRDVMTRFGFGAQTGVDLPGERGGILRKVEQIRPVELANNSFGQGMTATPLQIAAGYAAIAAGGVWHTPHIVRRVVDDNGQTVFAPEVQERRVISPQLAATMRTMLHSVTQKGGTAESLSIPGYTFAGKTGTAQKVDPQTRHYSKDNWASSFVGFAPADNPRLVLFVMVDEPYGTHYGSLVAGPVFTETMGDALRWLGVPPNLPIPDPAQKPAIAAAGAAPKPVAKPKPVAPPPVVDAPEPAEDPADDAASVPDFTGMTIVEVLRSARTTGLRVEVRGSGVAVAQSPGPGHFRRGQLCRVIFSPPT